MKVGYYLNFRAKNLKKTFSDDFQTLCNSLFQRLRHENLINLIEVFRKRRKLYLVFEYVDHTVLEELEDHPKGLPSETARSHVFQVLRGIEFCHQNNVSWEVFKISVSGFSDFLIIL